MEGGEELAQGVISTKKVISIIVVTWVISLITTLALIYIWSNIFPIKSEQIANEAIVTAKLADGSVTSAKILDGTIIAEDLATGSVISMKIADGAVTTEKIANGAVTNVKLAAGAIPFNVTYATGYASTNSTGFVDMPNMAVKITLTRNSTLVIICSAQAWLGGTGAYTMYWRAMVNNTQAFPRSDWIIITRSTEYGSYSYTFVCPNVAAGTYIVKIQWRVYQSSHTGYVDERILTVIALPS